MEHNYEQQLLHYRRDFHRHPETAWLEYRTSAVLAGRLEKLGYEVRVGEEMIDLDKMISPPEEETRNRQKDRVQEEMPGRKPYLARMGNATGVIGVMDTHRPGPLTAFRFDIDALPIDEAKDSSHKPCRQKFRSIWEQRMHACGHDGHSAVGIVLAEAIMENAAILCGRIMFLFQPAEEGAKGGKSMSDSWKYPIPDYLFAFHIGFAEPDELVCGVDQFLVTTKFDVTFTGESAHAGTTPNKTRNALLAAAEATLQFQEIPPSPEGTIRVNIGCLTAGEARNAIAAKAFLQGETRGETEKLDAYVINEVQKLVPQCAARYQTEAELRVVGRTASEPSDPRLCQLIARQAEDLGIYRRITLHKHFPASEDATWLMRIVREQGGKASYLLFGTPMEAGHHSPDFDFDEEVLTKAFTLLFRLACVVNQAGDELGYLDN